MHMLIWEPHKYTGNWGQLQKKSQNHPSQDLKKIVQWKTYHETYPIGLLTNWSECGNASVFGHSSCQPSANFPVPLWLINGWWLCTQPFEHVSSSLLIDSFEKSDTSRTIQHFSRVVSLFLDSPMPLVLCSFQEWNGTLGQGMRAVPGVKSKTQLGITAPSSSLIAYALSTCTSCETKFKVERMQSPKIWTVPDFRNSYTPSEEFIR